MKRLPSYLWGSWPGKENRVCKLYKKGERLFEEWKKKNGKKQNKEKKKKKKEEQETSPKICVDGWRGSMY